MELRAHLDLAPAWHELQAKLREAVGASAYDVWFTSLAPRSWDGSVLVIESRAGTERFIADRFGAILERCARAVLGASANVAFAGDAAMLARDALTAVGQEHADPRLRSQPFVPRYTFAQFIIGDSNRLAHAAALAVAEAPGQAYNPLFLHAPPGLGKTHLLHAIGNYLAAAEPGTTVRYATAEAFTNNFLLALQGKSLDRFKQLYREVDVLLLDDVQFLASKVKTEEELFHTFNALYDSGRQLVLTADCLPSRLTGLQQRLRERFESGLVAELTAPDTATLVAILRKRAAIDQVPLADPSVLELIANRINDNVRSLEGAFVRIVAVHSLTGRAIDAALTLEVLDDIHPAQPAKAGPSTAPLPTIQSLVAAHFELTQEALRSPSRAVRVAWPRQVAIALCRELTNASLVEIGRAFGGRDHATVVHATKRVQSRVQTNSQDAALLTALRSQISSALADRSC